MDNAGIYTLAALPIAGAMSPAKLLTPIPDLDGMSSVSIEANLQFGSGGATLSAIVATSFDGVNWRHIARFDFTTASAVKLANIQATAAKGITAYNDLSVEGVNDGMLADQLAVFVVSSGTYVNTTLSVRASVR